jgi:hypothetical protein
MITISDDNRGLPRSSDQLRLQKALSAYGDSHGIDLECSGLYHLRDEWVRNYFPFAESPGCYLIFDEELRLLYIGKASLNNSMGARIATHLKRDRATSEISFVHPDGTNPFYLQTVKVNKAYQAPSLEEYLIGELQPPRNVLKGRIEAEAD